jgi:aminoglycoside phosphotransferase family enzyme
MSPALAKKRAHPAPVHSSRAEHRVPRRLKPGTAGPDRLLAFLHDARSYPDHPRHIRMLQTHASWVVLTRRFAYKVKKPVNLGFLDFSTVEKRRHFCEREVALNARLSPGMYLGVVPISRKKGRLVFGPGERVVEYAVKMRRLPERFFLLRLMERGAVTPRDVDRIVATLKLFYEAQQPTREIANWGRVTKLKLSTDENFRQTRDFIDVTISRAAFLVTRLYTNAFYRNHASLFATRIREGWIRDCHGDLHLDHIHLTPTRLTIYDCIEFDDRFRCIDIASDAAFLAMDFDFRDRPDLSRYFATRLAKALGDAGLLRLLDFYKCYRAYVRGKVESLHAEADGVPDAERQESRARAQRYFRLGLRYAACGSEPMVLIIMGRVGSGKSTLAQALGRELGWDVFSADRIRKELAGVALDQRAGAAERRRLYTKRMSDKTYATLTRHAVEQARQRHGVILDATFANRRRRDSLRRALNRARITYCFIETRTATATIKTRLKARARSTSEISDARLDDFPMLDALYEPPMELERRHFFTVKAARTPESVLLATLRILAQHRARIAPNP